MPNFHVILFTGFLLLFSLSLQAQKVLRASKTKEYLLVTKEKNQTYKVGDKIRIMDRLDPKIQKGVYEVIKETKKNNLIAKKVEGEADKNDLFFLIPLGISAAASNAGRSLVGINSSGNNDNQSSNASDPNNPNPNDGNPKNPPKDDPSKDPSKTPQGIQELKDRHTNGIISRDEENSKIRVVKVSPPNVTFESKEGKVDKKFIYKSVTDSSFVSENGSVYFTENSLPLSQGIISNGSPMVGDLLIKTNFKYNPVPKKKKAVAKVTNTEEEEFRNEVARQEELKKNLFGIFLGTGYYWPTDLKTDSGNFGVNPGLAYYLGFAYSKYSHMWTLAFTYFKSEANFKSQTFVELTDLKFKLYRLSLEYSAPIKSSRFSTIFGLGLVRNEVEGQVVGYGPYELNSHGINLDLKLAYQLGKSIHSPRLVFGFSGNFFFSADASGPNTTNGPVTLDPKKAGFGNIDLSFYWPLFF